MQRFRETREQITEDLRELGNWTLQQLFPATCRLCLAPVQLGDFCNECRSELNESKPLMTRSCRRCATPLPLDEEKEKEQNPLEVTQKHCPSCVNQTVHWHRADAMWAYRGRVRDAIVKAKSTHNSALSHALGVQLGEYLERTYQLAKPDLVTFVPSHRNRRVTRGGEGTAFLAQGVAATLGRPCRNLLSVRRPIAKQAWLNDFQRSQNVKDAFKIRSIHFTHFRKAGTSPHVLIVDDVMTTGATANEVCRTLKRAGAKCLSVSVVARSLTR